MPEETTASSYMWRNGQVSDEIRCNVDDLQSTFAQLLKDYGDKATKAINLAVEDEAKDVRKQIRQEAGSAGIRGKRYKGGWQIKKEVRASGVQCTVYNGVTPGLVHLLEKGHRVVVKGKNVGQASAYPHVAPVTKNLDKDLEEKIRQKLDLLS